MNSPAIPEWEQLDIPEDDEAEPINANVSHNAPTPPEPE